MRARYLVALALSGVASGCNRPYFSWSLREPLAARHGRVALAVEDRRTGDRAVIGRAFGFGGIPLEIRIGEDEPRERLSRLLTEATFTAGVGVAGVGDAPSARVTLSLEALACRGETMTARAEVRVRLAIADVQGVPRIEPETLVLDGKARGCRLAYYAAFDRLLDELGARLVEGPAHDAVL